jgi:hypothetical protein
MAIDADSLQMETTISWETQSKTIEYTFKWQNFGVTENSKIVSAMCSEWQTSANCRATENLSRKLQHPMKKYGPVKAQSPSMPRD